MCPQERLVIISYTTGLSFALERIGPLAEIIIIVFYLLVLYLLALSNTPENPFASIYSKSLIKNWLSTASPPRCVRHSYLSKVLRYTPYTCGSSNYTDTMECDVVPMNVCHLLLGRTWQYDRDVHHNGKANTHQQQWTGKDNILHPMTPQAIVNES
jgi:hypothetical protein